MRPATTLSALLLALGVACATPPASDVRTARLGATFAQPGDDAPGFAELRAAFEARNPGHALSFHRAATRLPSAPSARIAFVQRGEARGVVARLQGEARSPLAVGDAVCLRPGWSLRSDAPRDVLVFALPAALPDELPIFVRPDWDPRITDTPGGCATEEGAYRRILLTWLPSVGPYVLHGLNAHRVRIMDSFTHYHPVEHGFDELYLVQMVQPGARLLTSARGAAIEARAVTRDDVDALFTTHELAVGDLVYLPRGTIHRGLGGVLAQVITVPGFRPGAEIGVDHHLRAINAALGLTGADALPLHAASADAPLVR